MKQSVTNRSQGIQRKGKLLILTAVAFALLFGDASLSHAASEVHAYRRPVKKRIIKKPNAPQEMNGPRMSIANIGWGGCTTCSTGK